MPTSTFFHLPPEKQLVLGHMLPAVGFAEIAQILRLLRGAAVAQVIVPAHHEAAIAQGPGKPVVPAKGQFIRLSVPSAIAALHGLNCNAVFQPQAAPGAALPLLL